MPNRKRTPHPLRTQESLALQEARKRSGLSQEALAAHMGLTSGMVSQWELGRRPVPSDKAAALAALLSVDPGEISSSYRKLRDIGVVKPDAAGADPDIADMKAQIRALNMGVALLVGQMVEFRPAEARELADAIQRLVPAPMREAGLFRQLLAALEKR